MTLLIFILVCAKNSVLNRRIGWKTNASSSNKMSHAWLQLALTGRSVSSPRRAAGCSPMPIALKSTPWTRLASRTSAWLGLERLGWQVKLSSSLMLMHCLNVLQSQWGFHFLVTINDRLLTTTNEQYRRYVLLVVVVNFTKGPTGPPPYYSYLFKGFGDLTYFPTLIHWTSTWVKV